MATLTREEMVIVAEAAERWPKGHGFAWLLYNDRTEETDGERVAELIRCDDRAVLCG
jgi:hypothetical protein